MTAADWAAPFIEAGRQASGPYVVYGSPEWQALPASDPRKLAAVVVAAELWRQDGTAEAISARLRAELDEADHLAHWRIRSALVEFEEALREFMQGRGHVVSHDELQRRRAEVPNSG